MRTEESIKKQLELKVETYETQNDRISLALLEGWINALRYVLELPQKW